MTEFWVSQGNKWCDFCKIYISNNSTSIRTHELGTRHKDNVAKKLAGIKKDNAVKEKEKLLALKDLEKIEMQAKKSYELDLAARTSSDTALKKPQIGKEGFHRKIPVALRSSCAEPGTDGRNEFPMIRIPEAFCEAGPAAQRGSEREPVKQKTVRNAIPQAPKGEASQMSQDETNRSIYATQMASNASRFGRSGKVKVASSVEVSKRKRVESSGSSSSEEAAALAARESARKRMKDREESLLGLYHAF